MKILIVDDSRIMRNILKNIVRELDRDDIRIFEAEDGVEAYEILEKHTLDLLLLDWNMPRLDGLELVRKMRANVEYDIVPVLMITSEAAKYNVIEAIKEGVNDYIVKPVSEDNLLQKIKNILED